MSDDETQGGASTGHLKTKSKPTLNLRPQDENGSNGPKQSQNQQWGKHGAKYKKTASGYRKLKRHVKYRIAVIDAGGKITDAVEVWDAALKFESIDYPNDPLDKHPEAQENKTDTDNQPKSI
ncbi:unnamed protein product [Clavelina lepadiformis]|uniref:Uncharacterized protein n=1 Tax=Clavelina lepadiformis TaxID=159417 RepID=A0ABP0GQS4_CLALP